MYKLPKDFDGAFLNGKKLDLVSFSENTVYFAFQKNVSITVTSSLQHTTMNNTPAAVQHVPLTESRLMQLVGQSVTQVKGDIDGTLTILFENGHLLRIFDDQPNYESYSINDGIREIYV